MKCIPLMGIKGAGLGLLMEELRIGELGYDGLGDKLVNACGGARERRLRARRLTGCGDEGAGAWNDAEVTMGGVKGIGAKGPSLSCIDVGIPSSWLFAS